MLHQCLQALHCAQQLLQVSLVSSLLLLHLSALPGHLCHFCLQHVAGLADVLVLSAAGCQLEVQAVSLLGRGVQCCLQGQGAKVWVPLTVLSGALNLQVSCRIGCRLGSAWLPLSAEAACLLNSAEKKGQKLEAGTLLSDMELPLVLQGWLFLAERSPASLQCKKGTLARCARQDVLPLRVAAAL